MIRDLPLAGQQGPATSLTSNTLEKKPTKLGDLQGRFTSIKEA